MDEANDLSNAEPLGYFEVRPYKADGGYSMGGVLQLIGTLGICGMILGAITSFISQYFYLVLLFPIVIGGIMGAIGAFFIKMFHIRAPLMCGLAGFIAGCLAMIAVQFTDYRNFQSQLGPDAEVLMEIADNFDELKANMEELPEEVKALIEELDQNPEFLRALRVKTFFDYVDFSAHQGVEIGRARGGKAMNLGYTGSYIYWGVEMLIVAGIAFMIMSGAADEPYCPECGVWKDQRVLRDIDDATHVSNRLSSGHIEAFPVGESTAMPDARVTLSVCPDCGEEGDIDVKVERVKVNAKEEESTSMLSHTTYPGEALAVLIQGCDTHVALNNVVENEVEETDEEDSGEEE